mmetsp:Transcript_30669/g.55149  ORF Transcript_30669/g.55149 Transcript_30669/m.55149 type:complete len:229 (-) Transcript_30669:376-1062(-)
MQRNHLCSYRHRRPCRRTKRLRQVTCRSQCPHPSWDRSHYLHPNRDRHLGPMSCAAAPRVSAQRGGWRCSMTAIGALSVAAAGMMGLAPMGPAMRRLCVHRWEWMGARSARWARRCTAMGYPFTSTRWSVKGQRMRSRNAHMAAGASIAARTQRMLQCSALAVKSGTATARVYQMPTGQGRATSVLHRMQRRLGGRTTNARLYQHQNRPPVRCHRTTCRRPKRSKELH